MKRSQKPAGKKLEFEAALKSFLGYLEGTQKALHTIKNYRLDILAFQRFLETEIQKKPIKLSQVGPSEVDLYQNFLKTQGFKTNTRRRKLLTLQKFFHYLARRKKLAIELDRKLPTPHKIERTPFTVPLDALLAAIQELPTDTLLDLRNKTLLWMLAETGALVSEVTRVRFEDCSDAAVFFGGKSMRSLPISRELRALVAELETRMNARSPWVFQGFNKFGSLGGAITSRGVEILVKIYAPRLGFPELTPRTFRHSVVLKWFKEGKSPDEIQQKLGLRTKYAFKIFEPLLKSSSRPTSTV